MASKQSFRPIKVNKNEEPTLKEVIAHYNIWNEDNEHRQSRKGGWDDITDAYYGKLPADWPFLARVIDPVLRTTVIEKNARLMNSKLRGRLVPREGGDVLSARLNNAVLDFQWDNAMHGGSMLEKWAMTEQDTRLYASKFAEVPWLCIKDEKGKYLFDGNEFRPLDIRDCGMDPNCEHIRDAKWFQQREWMSLEELEKVSEADQKPLYPGIGELKARMSEGKSDRRDTRWNNRILHLKGLEDRMGDDKAFPVLEVVIEKRPDRYITFSPVYKTILRDIPNPYAHKKINVIQLRYYAIQGDPLGESEAESVLPLWKAIQFNLNGYLDGLALRLRPPKKVLDGKARIETIVDAPEALWIVDQVDAVTEHQINPESDRAFQLTHSALKAAFNTAMGDLSQGTGGVDPFNPEKTATEIRQSAKQQNSRDEKNQTSIAEAIQDMMTMWLSNNKQFLFADPDKQEYILEIVGTEMFNYFKRAGLDEMELTEEAMTTIGDVISMEGGNMSDDDIMQLVDAGKTPKHPVIENPEEEDPYKIKYHPKMEMNEMGDGAKLSIVPDDLNGTFNYIPDVKSMASGADVELQNARQTALKTLVENPTVLQLLQIEGVQPQIKEILISMFEDTGLKDAERFFQQSQTSPGIAPGGGPQLSPQTGGIPPELAAVIGAGANPTTAQPQGFPQPGQVPGGVQPGIGQAPPSQGANQPFAGG